jgi:tetrathionate reductase subunit A
MNKKSNPEEINAGRRVFLAQGALLGTALTAGAVTSASAGEANAALLNNKHPDVPYGQADLRNTIYSVCLNCNTGCGIKCKIQDGVLSKIDGNPYNPWTLLPHLPYATDPAAAVQVDGSICPKGQAGIQVAYDPYRLRKVLKRAGKRGENKWISIPFDQAVEEICEGGKLFASVPGEEKREIEGLRQLHAMTDPVLSKEMAADVKACWDEKDKAKKAEKFAAFKTKYADRLDQLIDPDHPDLGPVNNQIVLSWGRLKAGRSEFYKRFAAGLGTTNAHGHTTVCQGSLYFTCKAISDQYEGGKFSGGKKFYWQADLENAEFVLFVGANLFEANYGPPNRSVRLTENLATGKTRIAVVDPRFSKLANKAWKWLPLKPGTDAALALGMIRWMIENNGYDATFLSCANKAAAIAAGETSWSNATTLVEVKNGQPGKLVRAADVGLCQAETRTTKDGKEYSEKFLVAMVNGQPVKLDPNDTVNPVTADLFVDATLADGTRVKSGLQVLRESAEEHSIAEWAEIAGVREEDLVAVAREMSRHGKKAGVDLHRGPAQHTNGYYNVLAWMSINLLLGNIDAKGGMSKPNTYDINGKGEWFDLKAQPGKTAAFGISSIRHEVDYEKTSLFAGYPAMRNWYPLSSDVYEEIIPSIADAYPYPVKILFMYMGAPTYALPAGHTNIEVLCDTGKLPLFIASDILVGSTSMYADYIFPDLSYLERWEFQGSHPNVANKVQPVRQPVIAPVPEECSVYGQTMPISFESMMLGIAERLELPGFGPDAFGAGKALRHPDDFYLRCVGNLAFGEKPDGSATLPPASAEEQEIFRAARRHLPASVFDENRWRAVVGEALWPQVVYLLNRGGRFEDHEKGYKGDKLAHPFGALLNLYQEKTASTIHAGTGAKHPGYAAYIPIRGFTGEEPTAMREGHPLAMITHRTISQCKSRTIASPWLSALMPENGILMNPVDAAAKGFKADQLVRVVSATNTAGVWDLGAGNSKPIVGKITLTQAIRPGVVSFALGFGHWATGASDFEVNGTVIKGEPRRGRGIHANAAMWTDPHVKNTCMFDPVGGSVSFYDTYVDLVPV